MKKRKLDLNPEDVFNALLVDPIADAIRRTLERGYTGKEIVQGLERALDHAKNEYGKVS